ncbi:MULTISPECIES: hypothetical protein [unclassified Mesorhizobium]|uniref:hypothetical protein n=1 Tax=unclassified Mesorhizobium TaxID=325217 RepID=UPI0024163B6B|nr:MULTISPECIES: hypothetical protein [unclassified Mesorhizobium]WFP61819.1 hypothetical protein QAZ47_25595 [Mesorhizobium sp. WSM4904]WFP75090.1 hypothetical protein QAZ22_25705 [Mesorhizobium sp. WSM4906]
MATKILYYQYFERMRRREREIASIKRDGKCRRNDCRSRRYGERHRPARAFHRFAETANRSISCFDAIPDGRPLRTFPGIALKRVAIFQIRALQVFDFAHVFVPKPLSGDMF